MQKRMLSLLAAGVAIAATTGWWLGGEHESTRGSVALASSASKGNSATSAGTPVELAPLSDAAAADPLLTPALITVFDGVLSEAAAPNKAAFMAMAPSLLAKQLPADLRVRALALLERYVDMQEAMQTLTPPDPRDPSSTRHTMEARNEIRKRYFAPEEVTGLFGDEIRQDAFMAEKMEIASNTQLTPEQRAEALRSTEGAYLSPDQQALRRQATAQVDVQRETDALNARGASAQERFAERSQRYGVGAARGLADLDSETNEWNQRLDTYANSTPEVQQRLRETLFSETERLRLSGALAMRAQSKQGG